MDNKTLGYILTFEYGTRLREDERSGTGFPVFGSNGLVGWNDEPLVTNPGIIVGRKGSVGAVNWSGTAFWPIDTTYYVIPRPGINIRWCYWVLMFLNLSKLDSSTGVPGLNRNDAYGERILVPSEPEQRCIAEILDAADEAIRKTDELIAKLKMMKKGFLHDLLTRGVDGEGRLRNPGKRPHDFKLSKLGEIPVSWNVRLFGECCVVLYRYPTYYGIEYVEEGVPEVRGELIKDDGTLSSNPRDYRYISLRTAMRFPRVRLEPGDFVMSVRGTMGKVAVVPSFLNGAVVTANLIRIKFDQGLISKRWAKHLLGSYFFQNALDATTSATTIKTIQAPMLRAIEIVTPPVPDQQEIADILDGHDARIRAEEAYRDKLKMIKKGLMHDLLTGRMRVKT